MYAKAGIAAVALVAIVVLVAALAWAPSRPPTDLGEPAAFGVAFLCGVVLKYYDYVPEDQDYWRAVSLHIDTEEQWFALLVWPAPGANELEFWVDLDRDGTPDKYERLTNSEFEAKYTWSACTIMERVGVR